MFKLGRKNISTESINTSLALILYLTLNSTKQKYIFHNPLMMPDLYKTGVYRLNYIILY